MAEAAAEEGCLVAPVGSVYYLFHEANRALTKDVDAVVHDERLEVPDIHVLRRIGARLGTTEETQDGAVLAVYTRRGQADPDLELVRGRRRPKGGFMPRALLELAAKNATRQDHILLYPPEFVLVLKADAAVDREQRAARDPERREENMKRADVFRADVFAEVRRLRESGRVDLEYVHAALECLKRSRRKDVAELLSAAGLALDSASGPSDPVAP